MAKLTVHFEKLRGLLALPEGCEISGARIVGHAVELDVDVPGVEGDAPVRIVTTCNSWVQPC